MSIEEATKMLVAHIEYIKKFPPCREHSIAITKLEEAIMWLNKPKDTPPKT